MIFKAAGDWLLITWGWAMAVAFAVWVAGGVSGAHLNPAVTLAFAVRRKFAWPKVAALLGALRCSARFVGAALVFLVYHSAIDAFNLAAKTPKSGGQRAGDVLDLRHVPGRVLPRRDALAADRPDRRHRCSC